MSELLEIIDDVVDDLDSRAEVEHVHTIIERGTSADRQLAVFHAHGGDENSQESLKAVVDFLIEETKRGVID